MKASKLIVSGFIAGCCVLAQADTFYWKGGPTWKSFGETTSWDQTTFVSGSDTGNATRIPGSSDDLEMACNANMDLDGASYTVNNFKSISMQAGGNNWSRYTYCLTNGTLNVANLYQTRLPTLYVCDGATLRIKTAYISNGSLASHDEKLEVRSGGTIEYYNDYVCYFANHHILPGGTYIMNLTHARMAPGGIATITNEGTLRILKGLTWENFTGDSRRSMTLNQVAGTLELAGSYSWTTATDYGTGYLNLSGGTVKATGAVSFSNMNCAVTDDADLTFQIANADASFDLLPFVWGSNVKAEINVVEGGAFDLSEVAFAADTQVRKTGSGALKTPLPLPSNVTIVDACPIILSERIRDSLQLGSLPAGTEIWLTELKNVIASKTDVENLTFRIDASKLVNGDILVISADADALTFLKDQFETQIPANTELAIVGGRLIYRVGTIVELNVASGTQTIAQALAAYNTAHGTSYSTDDDGSSLGSVVLAKTGEGQLDFDTSIPNYMGQILVEQGVAHVTTYYGLGSGATGEKKAADAEATKTRVVDGATIIMDVTENMTGSDAKASEYEAIVYEGAGTDGKGANIIRRSSGSATSLYWAMGHYPALSDDATIRLETPYLAGVTWSPSPDSTLNLNGHALTIVGAADEVSHPAGAFLLNAVNISSGCIVCTNVDLQLQYQPGFNAGSGGNRLTIGEDAMLCFKGGPNAIKTQWTLVFEEGNRGLKIGTQLVTWDENATNDNYWSGPVQLNGNLNLQNGINENNATFGCNLTLKGKVSGKGGIRPTPCNPNLRSKQGINFHLVNPENDFEGGLVASSGQVVLHSATALPANGGKLILTNSVLCLAASVGADVYSLPDAEFVGVCTNRHGHGSFKNVVKSGAGTLAWFSGTGATSLTVREGGVQFAPLDSIEYADAATVTPAIPAMTFAAGTTLDLNGRDYSVTALGGVPTVTGGDLTVTGTWTLETAQVYGTDARLSVDGVLTFADGAVLDVPADFKRGRNPIATATGGIVGLPVLSQTAQDQRWALVLSEDGKSLSLVRQGLMFILR